MWARSSKSTQSRKLADESVPRIRPLGHRRTLGCRSVASATRGEGSAFFHYATDHPRDRFTDVSAFGRFSSVVDPPQQVRRLASARLLNRSVGRRYLRAFFEQRPEQCFPDCAWPMDDSLSGQRSDASPSGTLGNLARHPNTQTLTKRQPARCRARVQIIPAPAVGVRPAGCHLGACARTNVH